MAFEERTTTAGLEGQESVENDVLHKSGRADLSSRLFQEGYLFDFFQSVWLLEQALAPGSAEDEPPDVLEERIRIRPHTSLAFPPSDVRKIERLESESDDARVQMTVTFMGLYGVASPLPVYFYDAIGTRREEAEPLRDFLDIFNRRLYTYFYKAWKKYRSILRPIASAHDRDARVFLSLAGMGTPGFARSAQVNPMRLAALAGFLSSGVRNALGLQTMVSTLFDGLPARIQENVPRWVSVRERPRMGSNASGSMVLGNSALLGQKVRDASGKFRLILGPLGLDRFRTFLPEGESATLLDYMVRLYTTDYFDYDVELVLRTSEVPPMSLGGPQMLGIDAWLGRPAGDVISVVIQYS